MSLSDLNVELVPKPNAPGEWTVKQKLQTLSFDKGFFVAVKAIQLLRKKHNRTIIVSIAGPSGAGKTSLAHKIVEVIPKSLIISLDNYLDSSRGVLEDNFDDYRLVDFALLITNIRELREGKTTQLPLYDFRKSGRYAYLATGPPESKVVIVEGIYALHETIRTYLDLAISISGGVHFDLIKRILRDIQRTGQEPHEAIQQITETVYPMYKAFIEPDLALAQIKIVNTFNPFSGLLNPIYTLKSPNAVPPEKVSEVVENLKTPRTEKYYDIYLRPPATLGTPPNAPSTSNDWIRMRNSGGVYTLMFSDNLKEGDFIISPYLDFVVNVRVLGGLMGLGYQISAIIHRTSIIYETDDKTLSVSYDSLEELGQTFIQVKGSDRKSVQQVGEQLGLTGSYVPQSYIEIYQNKLGSEIPNLRNTDIVPKL